MALISCIFSNQFSPKLSDEEKFVASSNAAAANIFGLYNKHRGTPRLIGMLLFKAHSMPFLFTCLWYNNVQALRIDDGDTGRK